jgi:oligosaccharide repeat unit polymerase
MIALVVSTLAGILIGRWLLGRWVNHVSIYSVVWGISLFACELHLLVYNPISTVAWLYIAIAWMSVILGSALVVFATRDQSSDRAVMPEFNLSYLRIPILVLSLLTGISVVTQLKQTQAEYGSALGALALAPADVYQLHTQGELAGAPYLSLTSLGATCLAGLYTARLKKFTVTAAIALLAMTASSVVSMTKAGVMIGSVLFAYSYMFAPGSHAFSRRGLIKTVVACTLLMGAFMLMSSYRGAYSVYERQTSTLNDIADYSGGFPTLYFYLSAPSPTLSQYLLHPEVDNYSFFASNTFAPIWRLLAKLGFRTYIPFYLPYYYTPSDTNQATYLAYVDADFGPAGIVLVPAILSAMLSSLYLSNLRQFRCWRLILYSFLLVVMTYSFSGYYVSLTYWFVACIVSVLIGWWIDNATRRQRLVVPALN